MSFGGWWEVGSYLTQHVRAQTETHTLTYIIMLFCFFFPAYIESLLSKADHKPGAKFTHKTFFNVHHSFKNVIIN